MWKLKTREDVWVLTPSADDLKAGAHYAAVSLPWTIQPHDVQHVLGRPTASRPETLRRALLGKKCSSARWNGLG